MRYQITRAGDGFKGRKMRRLGTVMRRLNRRLSRVHGPFTVNEAPKGYNQREAVQEVRNRFQDHPNAEF